MSRYLRHPRWRLLLPLLLLAVTVSASAATQDTATVSVYSTGFVANNHKVSGERSTTKIMVGDTIRWHNADRKGDHQVVAEDGSFVSPILRPDQKWMSPTFTTEGDYTYYDGKNPSRKGRIIVTAPPAGVSLTASETIITYSPVNVGGRVTLSGRINRSSGGQLVQIRERRYDQPSYSILDEVVTAPDGSFGYTVSPAFLTYYQAAWQNAVSGQVLIQVRPRVTLSHIFSQWAVHVSAGRPLRGKAVRVQRQVGSQWVYVTTVKLTYGANARFKLNLPRGTHIIRASISVNQAGPGYLSSFSRSVVWRVR